MAVILGFFFILVLALAINAGLCLILQWALLACFGVTVPFWPLFILVLVVGWLVRGMVK